MKITQNLTDEAVLQELGGRLAGARIERDLTQAALAERAGVSKRTVERLESGEVAIQLSGFIRVCRALDMLEQLGNSLPDTTPGPMARMKQLGRKRRRATGKNTRAGVTKPWTWGETP